MTIFYWKSFPLYDLQENIILILGTHNNQCDDPPDVVSEIRQLTTHSANPDPFSP